MFGLLVPSGAMARSTITRGIPVLLFDGNSSERARSTLIVFVHRAANRPLVARLQRPEVVAEDVPERVELITRQLGVTVEDEPRHRLGTRRRRQGSGVGVVPE